MNENFEFPEQPENRQELPSWQSYHAGLIDGEIRTGLQANTGRIYCSINNPNLKLYFQDLFGGSLNKQCWELFGVRNILNAYEQYSQFFRLSSIRSFEFDYFFKVLQAIRENNIKDQEYYYTQFRRIRDQHVFKPTGFTFPHLVGYIDTGRGSIFIERKRYGADRLHIEFKHMNKIFVSRIHEILGGRINSVISQASNHIYSCRFSGTTAVYLAHRIYPWLHFRKLELHKTLEELNFLPT